MIKAKEIIKKLSTDDILKIMNRLGTDGIYSNDRNKLLFRTVCHNGNSQKLIYYIDDKSFYCFTGCNCKMNIINVVEKAKEITFHEAIRWISDICNLSIVKYGFEESYEDIENENDKIKHLIKIKKEEKTELKIIDSNILNLFYDKYHANFFNDGICIEAMQKYNIKFDILNNRIIIPHYSKNGDLICIRSRNLDKRLIEAKRKYTPITYKNQVLSAPSSAYLYGLNFNKHNITKYKKIILVESEKAVLQLETFYPNENIAVALSGSAFSQIHIKEIIDLGVEEVILGLDKEYEKINTLEETIYKKKILSKFVKKILPYAKVSILWDTKNLLNIKDSPTDRGKETFEKLLGNRFMIGGDIDGI